MPLRAVNRSLKYNNNQATTTTTAIKQQQHEWPQGNSAACNASCVFLFFWCLFSFLKILQVTSFPSRFVWKGGGGVERLYLIVFVDLTVALFPGVFHCALIFSSVFCAPVNEQFSENPLCCQAAFRSDRHPSLHWRWLFWFFFSSSAISNIRAEARSEATIKTLSPSPSPVAVEKSVISLVFSFLYSSLNKCSFF